MRKWIQRGNFILIGLGLGMTSLAQEWKEPLPSFEPNTWNWVDIEGAYCRDGSPAGILVNYSGESKNAVIYLEGGGACFNSQTCGLNPSSANRTPPGSDGIFNRNRSDNPVADWNIVYVPYCTGDVFAGSKEDGYISSRIKDQKFVGYRNITRIMERVAPTFSAADKILLTGISAGGFGSVLNYDQVQRFVDPIPVALLDDSGISISDEYLAPCLQKKFRDTWDLVMPEDCEICNQEDGGGLINIGSYLLSKYPDRDFAFISTLVSLFFFPYHTFYSFLAMLLAGCK